ncbi:uncharacterized protein LOC132724208 [Ruditapes philippinarum]|uniref:uncharacterized protein LOC132724208 n=1 Tax=Ruditapes philippinarum TaxID=129788 RepID=UPI00295AC106|nr:uncharacterized protein LOC132724208 [Ruditapes philippinarum]
MAVNQLINIIVQERIEFQAAKERNRQLDLQILALQANLTASRTEVSQLRKRNQELTEECELQKSKHEQVINAVDKIVAQQEVFVSKIEELSNKPSNVYSTAVVETIGLNIASTITSTLASTIKKRLRKEDDNTADMEPTSTDDDHHRILTGCTLQPVVKLERLQYGVME